MDISTSGICKSGFNCYYVSFVNSLIRSSGYLGCVIDGKDGDGHCGHVGVEDSIVGLVGEAIGEVVGPGMGV